MARSFRARVGTQRINANLDPTQASYTRSIRDQMKAIEETYSEFVDHVKDVTPIVLEKALTPAFKLALKYVPKLTGDLMQSGYLEVRESGDRVQAEIGFGKGGFPFYAVYVHENMENRHAEPTSAKFLQRALQEESGKIGARLVKAYQEEVEL